MAKIWVHNDEYGRGSGGEKARLALEDLLEDAIPDLLYLRIVRERNDAVKVTRMKTHLKRSCSALNMCAGIGEEPCTASDVCREVAEALCMGIGLCGGEVHTRAGWNGRLHSMERLERLSHLETWVAGAQCFPGGQDSHE